MTGVTIGTTKLLSGSFTASSSASGGNVYIDFGNSTALATLGVWHTNDDSLSGTIGVAGNANAWLYGATSTNIAGKTVHVHIVQFER